MSAIGTLITKAYYSRAQVPLEDAAITVVDDEGKLLALRLTDSSGKTEPIRLTVPDFSESQQPGTPKPFVTVNLYARADGFEQILVREIQVFADTVTIQDLQMVPLAELPGSWNQAQVIDTPAQNLQEV